MFQDTDSSTPEKGKGLERAILKKIDRPKSGGRVIPHILKKKKRDHILINTA